MEYEDIKNNREIFKISENLYKCPICEAEKTIKGFIQHVKNHFYERDLTNFRNAGNQCNKKLHRSIIDNYNKNPNKCLYCSGEILAKENERIYEVKKRKFCSKSCSAKYNNTHRDENYYIKIKNTWKIKFPNREVKKIVKNRNQTKRELKEKQCNFCGNVFTTKSYSQVFCSPECRKKSYGTKEDLIKWVDDFVANNGYVPTSKMNVRMNRLAIKNYGSWNNAIKELGYEPHSQKYKKGYFPCKDGHVADSISEMMVDNWLFENNIKHERRKKYPNSKKDCDFYLIDFDIWLEYFGLANEDYVYDKNIIEKEKIAKENNLKLIGIKHEDLFPKINLLKRIKNYLKF